MLDKNKFITIWETITKNINAEKVLDDAVEQYNNSSRYYHNLQHIESCLALLDKYKNLAKNYNTLYLAIIFHDYIYDPSSIYNEIDSACAFMIKTHIFPVNEPDNPIAKVIELILATKHDKILTNSDEQLIADIDLSSLGLPTEEFDKNWENIRKEFWFIDDNKFLGSRLKILNELANKKHIFYHQEFINEFEEQARKNIKGWTAK